MYEVVLFRKCCGTVSTTLSSANHLYLNLSLQLNNALGQVYLNDYKELPELLLMLQESICQRKILHLPQLWEPLALTQGTIKCLLVF